MADESGRRPGEPREPELSVRLPPDPPRGVVVLLHGGRATATEPVRPWSAPLLRMSVMAGPLARRGRASGIAVALLRFRLRGWNGDRADPVADVDWALARLRSRFGELPAVLLGHSMGGRAALRAGGGPGVTGVVALAPWVPQGEPAAHLAGRRVLLAHGDEDRVTDPALTLAFAVRARRVADAVCLVRVAGSGHTMLRGAAVWQRIASEGALGLLGAAPLPADVAESFAVRVPAVEADAGLVVTRRARAARPNGR